MMESGEECILPAFEHSALVLMPLVEASAMVDVASQPAALQGSAALIRMPLQGRDVKGGEIALL
jgi:hypothetical protein